MRCDNCREEGTEENPVVLFEGRVLCKCCITAIGWIRGMSTGKMSLTVHILTVGHLWPISAHLMNYTSNARIAAKVSVTKPEELNFDTSEINATL